MINGLPQSNVPGFVQEKSMGKEIIGTGPRTLMTQLQMFFSFVSHLEKNENYV
jgi:hypothetical protein